MPDSEALGIDHGRDIDEGNGWEEGREGGKEGRERE